MGLGGEAYSQEQNCYSESSQGQMMRPSGYGSTMPSHNPMMGQGYGSHSHGHGQYGSHGHGHYGSHGQHGHRPYDSTNFSSSTTMAHTDGGYGYGNGNGMQQTHLSSNMGMGSTNYGHGHGQGYGYGSRPSQNTFMSNNWALKDTDE